MTIGKHALLLLALGLGACAPVADQNVAQNDTAAANGMAELQEQPGAQVSSSAVVAQPSANSGDGTDATTFPAALHGRWGLVPADCTSTRGDAKGLVTINPQEVRFYESVARPAKIVERTDRLIRGEFDFTGEGMEWTNYMTWSADGDRLTRVDSEEDSRLVYTRC